jgi:NAD(P)-dependent dehydrogenase (short-subunit alcohol dehydrogenase family)
MASGNVWFGQFRVLHFFFFNTYRLEFSVTGTTSGLGNALVHELLRTGNRVIATARNCEPLQGELNGRYDTDILKNVLVLQLDVTRSEDVKSALAAGVDKFGHIDVVVNNAGYVSFLNLCPSMSERCSLFIPFSQAVLAEVEACPIEDARNQFEVMFWGPVYTSREVSPLQALLGKRELNMSSPCRRSEFSVK